MSLKIGEGTGECLDFFTLKYGSCNRNTILREQMSINEYLNPILNDYIYIINSL